MTTIELEVAFDEKTGQTAHQVQCVARQVH